MEEQTDNMLIALTQQVGKGCPGLLDAVFGFLARRTDFYHVMAPHEKMGFPPGVAESMTFQHFKKWEEEHNKKNPPRPGIEEKWRKYEEEKKKAQEEAKIEKKEESKTEEITEEVSEERLEEEPKPTIEKKEKPKVDQKMLDISTYNGDVTEKYKWSQAFNEVSVQVDVPVGTKAKDLDVVIKPNHLLVKLKGNNESLLEGETDNLIKVDDSFWTMEDGDKLILTLAKGKEIIWKTVIKGDKEIDPKTVDNSKRLEDFDVETQGHLRKVLYE